MSLDLGNILSDGATGLEIGGPIGGLIGAGVGAVSGLLTGGQSSDLEELGKLLTFEEDLDVQDFGFQQWMDDFFKRYDTLTSAERNMHDTLMHIIRGVR